MSCLHCKVHNTNQRARRTKQGYATFYCPNCQRTFNERTGHPLNFCHYPSDIIFLVVLWQLRYKLSLRDLAEMFLIRGIEFTHETVRDWEERFAPMITVQLKAKRKGRPSSKWHVDETYLKINGQQMYLYRAIDRLGNLVDVRLSAKRDLAAAEAFFKQARQAVNYKPHTVTTDFAPLSWSRRTLRFVKSQRLLVIGSPTKNATFGDYKILLYIGLRENTLNYRSQAVDLGN